MSCSIEFTTTPERFCVAKTASGVAQNMSKNLYQDIL